MTADKTNPQKDKFDQFLKYLNTKVFQRIDRKILIYLIFVGFATFFWFLNTLGGAFNTTLEYPVRYVNLPENKVLVNELPKKLKLNVNAYGYTLLRYKLSPAPFPVIINLNTYAAQVNNPNLNRFSLHTRYAREEINRQIIKDIDVVDILPDTIVFQFANLVDKMVPIKPNVELEFMEQCMLDGEITFSPDSVLVSGPNNIIDTLSYIYTKNQDYSGLSKPLSRNISLAEVEKLKLGKKRVVMNIPVSKFTEAYIQVPITPINVPDSIDLVTFPRFCQVTYLVSLKNYDKIDKSDFILQVDYTKIKERIGHKLPVNLVLAPKSVSDIKLNPTHVEYLKEKQQ